MGSAAASQPRMLGRYALYEQIASGGMATVHIGRLLGPVGFARTVAIKRMRPQFAEDPEFVAMFLDEARVAARIRHPNVVPTLDVVTLEGELFLVMEYVQGESLARLIRLAIARGERIPAALVATLMSGVLHGLHAAHEAKNDHGEPLEIVHRDVTPQNVLVGCDGVARVLDFGVAKAVGRVQTTRQGQLKGKLPYMAPEQVRGNAARSSDVYAAAVVLWEALTCKRLFKGDTEAEIFANVLGGASIPPSHFAPELPPSLDAVTMRGLEVAPENRFATAREMARALENAVPLVGASVIGEWVEEVAKEALEERSARIARIETDSATDRSGALAAPAAAELRSRGSSRAGAAAPIPDDMLPTQMSSGSVSAPGRPSPSIVPQRRATHTALGAVVGVAFGLAAVVAVLFAIRRTRTSPTDPPPAAVASSSETPPVATSPPAAAARPTAAPTTTPSAAAPASAQAPTPPPASRPTPRPAPAAPPPRASAAPAASCHPPYYFDARGVRVFKPECL